VPPELHFLTPICTKSFVDWGIAPDHTGGAYSAPQMYSERRGGSGQNWERGEDEDREAWSSSFALGRKKVGA